MNSGSGYDIRYTPRCACLDVKDKHIRYTVTKRGEGDLVAIGRPNRTSIVVLTTGQAVAFVMSAANMELTNGDDLYLFVKGAADDTVIKLGSAAAVLSADSGHYNLEGGTSAEDLTFTI